MAKDKYRGILSRHKSTLAERLTNHSITVPSGCRLWVRGKTHHGYGKIKFHQITMAAHRAAWMDVNGPIPAGLFVCHRCDVPACINVEHLFLGTTDDNMADMVAKKRQAIGERSGGSKLTADQVRAIRVRRSESYKVLAKEYGVSVQMIYAIWKGRNWKHVG